jgi:hypothetical protein
MKYQARDVTISVGGVQLKGHNASISTRPIFEPPEQTFNCKCVVTKHLNPAHKHKDFIIAWANGAEIEFLNPIYGWESLPKSPTWNPKLSYRIKPTKTPLDLKIEKLEAKLVKLREQL